MREIKVKVYAQLSTLEVDSVRMKVGRRHAYLIGSGILVDLLACEIIIIFEDIGFDNTGRLFIHSWVDKPSHVIGWFYPITIIK